MTEIERPNLEQLQEAIRALFEPGQVVELRALGSRYTASGYYSNFDALAVDTLRLGKDADYGGIYWTIQCLNPALLARSPNRVTERAKVTTSDKDVTGFRWLLIDLDPERPAGISSSDAEKSAAYDVAASVIKFFRTEHNYEPFFADSGNGYHVLIRVDLPASDAPLVAKALVALAARFDVDGVKVDRSVFNPARISKAYGTIARKGTSISDRPHRASRLLSLGTVEPIARAVIENLAEQAPATKGKAKGSKKKVDDPAGKMEEFLAQGSVPHGERTAYNNGWKWLLDACPFDAAHVATSVIVTVSETGALGFHCSHNSCSQNRWAEFRQLVEEHIGHPFNFTDKEEESPALSGIVIETNPGHVTLMTEQSEVVLHNMGLKYFERNRELVHTSYGRETAKFRGIDRDPDSVIITPASRQTILRDLDDHATYVSKNPKGQDVVHVPPSLPAHIQDRVAKEPVYVPFPTLNMVTAAPVLLPSGQVSQNVFAEGVLFFSRDRHLYSPIADRPTLENARDAMEQFWEIFKGFPFVDPEHLDREPRDTASYSCTLAAVLSLVARPYLGLRAIPLFVTKASTPRSGKTKIAQAASCAGLGYKATAVSYRDEEELGKQLLPLMRAGDRAIMFDNLERTLQSAKLCTLVTEGILKDRILGLSEDITLKNFAVLFATGNNIVIGGDLAVRSLRIDIDAKLERPETRAFDFEPVQRATERHPQLVMAALTALRAFIVAGCPWKPERAPWGGFEEWDKLVSGCLTWLGFADPYEARERVISSDPIAEGNVDILEIWYERYKSRSVSLREIQKERGDLYEVFVKDGKWDGQHVKWVLRKMEGKICGGLQLVRDLGRGRFHVVKYDQQGEIVFRAVAPMTPILRP